MTNSNATGKLYNESGWGNSFGKPAFSVRSREICGFSKRRIVACNTGTYGPFALRGRSLPRYRVVVDILYRCRPDNDPPPRPIDGIGAYGNIAQGVSEPPHGIQSLVGGSFRGAPISASCF